MTIEVRIRWRFAAERAQQKRRTTAVTSAAPERPRGAQLRPKCTHPVRTDNKRLIVKYKLPRQLPDDPVRGSLMVVALPQQDDALYSLSRC